MDPSKPDHPFPRRPTRLERLFDHVEPVYFVTFNTYRRGRFLAHPEVHAAFVAFCHRAGQFNVAVGRYVLMPDHGHLFVAMPTVGDLSLEDWMRTLKTVVGKQILRLGVSKPHWQESFFDHVLRAEESHAQKWEYVRMNPVRAGLCRQPEDWPYQGEIVSL